MESYLSEEAKKISKIISIILIILLFIAVILYAGNKHIYMFMNYFFFRF